MRATRLAALVLAAAVAVAPAAEARTVTGNTGNLSVETLDASRSVNLTIRKATGNPFDEPAEGALPDGGLAGFIFTLRRVDGVDLTTAGGWETARSIRLNDARSAATGPTYSATTDDSGAARFEGLPVGLYFVVETPPETPGYTWRYGGPFLLTLPIGDVWGEQWDYDVQLTAKAGMTGLRHPEPDNPSPETSGTSTPPAPPTEHTPEPGYEPTPEPTPSREPAPTPTPGKKTPGRDAPGKSIPQRVTELASTGAGVITLVIAGLALVAAGLYLARRRRSAEGDV